MRYSADTSAVENLGGWLTTVVARRRGGRVAIDALSDPERLLRIDVSALDR